MEAVSMDRVPLGERVKIVEVEGEVMVVSMRDKKLRWNMLYKCCKVGEVGEDQQECFQFAKFIRNSLPTLFIFSHKNIIYAHLTLFHADHYR